MAIKKEPMKNVIITNTTVLYELNGIRGPILSPSPLPLSSILKLINGGINVYEVDPKDSKNKIKLTDENYDKVNFKEPTKKVETSIDKKEEVVKETTITDSTIISGTNSESFSNYYNTENTEPTVVTDTNSEAFTNSYKNKKDKKNK